ncbi:hypothetical protein [Bradyrhizobium genosp. P]|uniref:hypothetical protein n=1 Tax=Bradyrhizobium genosp. P TaxID=83641 RepID=UPI003CEB8EE5
MRDKFIDEITTPSTRLRSHKDALRKALTFGADATLLFTEPSVADADALATMEGFATAIRKVGAVSRRPDVTFTGEPAIDGDITQPGPGIIERFGGLQLTHVAGIAGLDLASRAP